MASAVVDEPVELGPDGRDDPELPGEDLREA